MRLAIFLLVLLASLSTFSAAETYYVSVNGSESNPGTQIDSAFLKLEQAVAAHDGGDTVLVMEGTYTLEGKYPGGLLWLKGGIDIDHPTVWAVYQEATVTIDQAGYQHFESDHPDSSQNHGVFHITGSFGCGTAVHRDIRVHYQESSLLPQSRRYIHLVWGSHHDNKY